jgi:hypothetical protein
MLARSRAAAAESIDAVSDKGASLTARSHSASRRRSSSRLIAQISSRALRT